MKKTLVTTVLVCAMTIFGFAASAQEQTVTLDGTVFKANVSKNLNLFVATSSEVNLAEKLSALSGAEKTLGYVRNGTGFVSLAQAVENAEVVPDGTANTASIRLGEFNEGDTIQFGYQDSNNGFHAFSSGKFTGDPSYYGGYNPDSFYQLDFSEDPFNGMIEIVIGEPLPAPAVTLIVALAAGALFLLYKNRGRRSLQTEQA